jgi:hypothetical protein
MCLETGDSYLVILCPATHGRNVPATGTSVEVKNLCSPEDVEVADKDSIILRPMTTP